MRDIRFFNSPNYKKKNYREVEKAIFQFDSLYLTSISFQQEPDLGEGTSAKDISQYPLEDILDETGTFVHDFYNNLNTEESDVCFLELASTRIENIRALLNLIGKHVYNREDNGSVELIIE